MQRPGDSFEQRAAVRVRLVVRVGNACGIDPVVASPHMHEHNVDAGRLGEDLGERRADGLTLAVGEHDHRAVPCGGPEV